MEKVKGVLQHGISFVRGIVLDVLADRENTVVENALTYEKKQEIIRATAMMLEADITYEKIIDLLQKYMHINDTEASKYLLDGRTTLAIRRLTSYLYGEGYQRAAIIDYVESNQLQKKFENDPSLLNLSPEKLMKAIEKMK